MSIKTAVVTGSSRGIGREIALMLSCHGYRVVVTGRQAEDVGQTVTKCGASAHGFVGDLTGESGLDSLFQDLAYHGFCPDLMVVNLGSGKTMSGWDIPLAEYQRQFDINFFSAVGVCHRSVANMQRHGGHIVVISSIAASEAIGAPIPYTAAKSALNSFAKMLSVQVGGMGIRVNIISPGNVMFPGSTWDDKQRMNPEKTASYISEHVVLNRFVMPEDIAKTVLFLEDNKAITGANIVVDAGQLRRIS